MIMKMIFLAVYTEMAENPDVRSINWPASYRILHEVAEN